jgi:hypothetical protein
LSLSPLFNLVEPGTHLNFSPLGKILIVFEVALPELALLKQREPPPEFFPKPATRHAHSVWAAAKATRTPSVSA